MNIFITIMRYDTECSTFAKTLTVVKFGVDKGRVRQTFISKIRFLMVDWIVLHGNCLARISAIRLFLLV